MNTKRKTLVCALMVIMLALQVVPASAQDGNPPTVEEKTSGESSWDDENWPIVKKETHKRKDVSTGQEIVETVVVRKEPPTNEKQPVKISMEIKIESSLRQFNQLIQQEHV